MRGLRGSREAPDFDRLSGAAGFHYRVPISMQTVEHVRPVQCRQQKIRGAFPQESERRFHPLRPGDEQVQPPKKPECGRVIRWTA